MPDINDYFQKKSASITRWRTFEISHPSFGVKRFVWEYVEKQFPLESDAPYNAGETVGFRPIYFETTGPAQESTPQVSLSIRIERVGSELKSELKKLDGFAGYQPAQLIWRDYLSNDLSEPARIYRLYVKSISMNTSAAVIVATDENPMTQRISRIATPSDFPGLVDV